MKNIIFYSWQSDLPNSSNRGFIESCIKLAIKDLANVGSFSLELNIDRDTKDEPGTPDITETIFKKIDRAKIFIADISIINQGAAGKKTSNPNVLIELGYAAKSLGWEKIICIYNTDYGQLEDMPFDLRQRRPLSYSLNNESKPTVRKNISKAIIANINLLHSNGLLFDSINDYFKEQVDTEILTFINYLNKILFGYKNEHLFSIVQRFMNLDEEEIRNKLSENSYIGFQIFKKLEVNELKLRSILEKYIASSYQNKEGATIIVDLISWVVRFDLFNRSRNSPNLFNYIGVSNNGFSIAPPQENIKNTEFPDRYILFKPIDAKHKQVIDFGDFIETDKIQGLLKTYKLNPEYLNIYTNIIKSFVDIGNKWLDLTNGEFILESKMFSISNKVKSNQG